MKPVRRALAYVFAFFALLFAMVSSGLLYISAALMPAGESIDGELIPWWEMDDDWKDKNVKR